jgi:hypothetical protein
MPTIWSAPPWSRACDEVLLIVLFVASLVAAEIGTRLGRGVPSAGDAGPPQRGRSSQLVP